MFRYDGCDISTKYRIFLYQDMLIFFKLCVKRRVKKCDFYNCATCNLKQHILNGTQVVLVVCVFLIFLGFSVFSSFYALCPVCPMLPTSLDCPSWQVTVYIKASLHRLKFNSSLFFNNANMLNFASFYGLSVFSKAYCIYNCEWPHRSIL